jgi:tetratricopeptide (TPR) repeat protein
MSTVSFYLRLLLRNLEFLGFLPETCYSRIAALYYERGNYQKAVSYWLKSESSHAGRDARLAKYNLYHLGYCCWSLGSLREAKGYLEKYFEIDKNNWQIACMIATFYAVISENEAAFAWHAHALMLEPKLFAPRVECVRLLSELGRDEEAIRYADEAFDVATTAIEKQIAESLKLRISGDIRQAIGILKAIVSQPDDMWVSQQFQKEDTQLMLARFQRDIGDMKAVLETLQSAVQHEPMDPWLANELAMEYVDQDIFIDRALSLIDDALRSQPQNAIFLDTKGQVLLKLGQTEKGETAIESSKKSFSEYHETKNRYRHATTSGVRSTH